MIPESCLHLPVGTIDDHRADAQLLGLLKDEALARISGCDKHHGGPLQHLTPQLAPISSATAHCNLGYDVMRAGEVADCVKEAETYCCYYKQRAVGMCIRSDEQHRDEGLKMCWTD